MLQTYNKLLLKRNNIIQFKYPSLGSAQSTHQIRQKAWRLDEWLAQQKEGRGTNFGAFLHT